ncbi:cytochrome P450 CYP72A616-like [Tasmannia lanceolata]|uniref:cytochrome P450 CYP72A616-like n=1 Tax=Tasmannia lanceolata TaxID=3420 RepID=UPI004063AE32
MRTLLSSFLHLGKAYSFFFQRMKDFLSMFLMISSSLLLFSWVVRIAYSLWWKPMNLGKLLKQQGIKGTNYKFFFGDLIEHGRSIKEAYSKPMNLNHQTVPRLLPFIHQTVQTYGKISMIWDGPTPRVIITDPELMKEALTNKSGHLNKLQLNPLIKVIVPGLVRLEGEKWAERRRMINPAFHLQKLKEMVPAFSISSSELIKRWGNLFGTQGSCELDVWPEFQNLSGDAISRTAFGSNYEEGKRIFQLQNEQTSLAIDAARMIYVPGFRFLPTRKNRRRVKLNKEIRNLLRDLINKKEKAMKMRESGNDDLLGMLLQFKSHDENESGNSVLTYEELIDECKLFYFAGQETTSVLLTWTIVLLAMNPSWQEKAREEVLQICGKSKPNSESINQFKIVTMILYEVLRLYPPITMHFRHAYKRIQLGEISLPAGVDVLLPVLLIHHDPEVWGKDAEEFKPERFCEGVSKAAKDQIAFFPFGWGPRICIGQNFAMIEVKMTMAMILQHFSFELSPSYTHAPSSIVSLKPQHGAQIILHQL